MPLADRMSSQLLGELSGNIRKESSREHGFGKWGPLGKNVQCLAHRGDMSLKAFFPDTSSEIPREPSPGPS